MRVPKRIELFLHRFGPNSGSQQIPEQRAGWDGSQMDYMGDIVGVDVLEILLFLDVMNQCFNVLMFFS